MSVFLMGVYDELCRKWKTVAKCGNGHDDATIMKLQKELKMRKINKVCIYACVICIHENLSNPTLNGITE